MPLLLIACVVVNAIAAAANFMAGNAAAGCLFIAAAVIWAINLGQAT